MTKPERVPDERDLEAPVVDATEQATPVSPEPDEPIDEPVRYGPDGPEVSEGDAVEQAQVVVLDDEDAYR